MKYLALNSIRKQKCGHPTILPQFALVMYKVVYALMCDIHGSMAFLLVSLDPVLSPTCSLHGGQGWVAAVVGGLGGWSVSKKFRNKQIVRTLNLPTTWKVL